MQQQSAGAAVRVVEGFPAAGRGEAAGLPGFSLNDAKDCRWPPPCSLRTSACRALGESRATFCRRQRPASGRWPPRKTPARALGESEPEPACGRDLAPGTLRSRSPKPQLLTRRSGSTHRMRLRRRTLLSQSRHPVSQCRCQVPHRLGHGTTRRAWKCAVESEPGAYRHAECGKETVLPIARQRSHSVVTPPFSGVLSARPALGEDALR